MAEDRATVLEIMADFAVRTGLTAGHHPPKRYLWTDAFGVCNFLELFRQTGEKRYRDQAVGLIEQVHTVLGRHRDDDPRDGWISGLDEEEGREHPTIGGLRIGKKLNERRPDEPYDEGLEWDRDGQYFHYLTKWMHALNRIAVVTGRMHYNRWALELAKTAHARFTHTPSSSREKRMYWKMSIDLSRPLVAAMGQHDALDALITYLQLTATAADDPKIQPEHNLDTEIAEAATMCEGVSWLTDDPLGIGGLLTDACRVTQLVLYSNYSLAGMLSRLLRDAEGGMAGFGRTDTLSYPADYRLAFRELGLSIGLQAIEKISLLIRQYPQYFPQQTALTRQLADFSQYLPLKEKIEHFWLTPENQKSKTWTEHIDINSVMLATSLGSDGYLLLR
ncbi:MAG TPA: hypothetical protein ENI88_09485 [Desulfobulbus sp.]|nr:hypothetical protein [Desulfobulbus sp.]